VKNLFVHIAAFGKSYAYMTGNIYDYFVEQYIGNAVRKRTGQNQDHCAEGHGNAKQYIAALLAQKVTKADFKNKIHFLFSLFP
jgi:hypothetical protein